MKEKTEKAITEEFTEDVKNEIREIENSQLCNLKKAKLRIIELKGILETLEEILEDES